MFDGYLSVGGVELVNAERAQSYLANLFPRHGVRVKGDVEVHTALAEDAYVDPATDGAPWANAAEPATLDFYGVVPISVTGIGDSTLAATVTESIVDGGSVGAGRDATRTIKVSALLVGKDELAVEAGLTWLKQAVRPEEQSGSDMDFFIDQPDVVLPADPNVKTNLAINPRAKALAGWAGKGFGATGGAGVYVLGSSTTRITHAWLDSNSPNNADSIEYVNNVETRRNRHHDSRSLYVGQWSTTGGISIASDYGAFFPVVQTALLITATQDLADGWRTGYTGDQMPTTAGAWQYGFCYVQNLSGRALNFRVVFKPFDASGAQLTEVAAPYVAVPAGGGLYPVTAQIRMPTGAVTVLMEISCQSALNGDSVHVGAFMSGTTTGNTSFFNGDSPDSVLPAGPTYQGGPDTYIEKIWTSQAEVGGNVDVGFFVPQIPAPPTGATVTFSAWLFSSKGILGGGLARIRWVGATGTIAGPSQYLPANTWTRVSVTGTVPAGATGMTLSLDVADVGNELTPATAIPISTIMRATGALVETGTTQVDPYFDGDTLETNDVRYAYTGDPLTSTSTATPKTLETQLFKYLRFYRNVAVESGPTIINRYQFGKNGCNGSAIQVEMIFVAGRPWAFAPDQDVTLSLSPLEFGITDDSRVRKNYAQNGAGNGNPQNTGDGGWYRLAIDETANGGTVVTSNVATTPLGVGGGSGAMPISTIPAGAYLMERIANFTLPDDAVAGHAFSSFISVYHTHTAPLSLRMVMSLVDVNNAAIPAGAGSWAKYVGATYVVQPNTPTLLAIDYGAGGFDASADSTNLYIQTVNAITIAGSAKTIYASKLLITDGTNAIGTVPYFDGDTLPDEEYGYSWDNPRHFSSTRTPDREDATEAALNDPLLVVPPSSPAAPAVQDVAVSTTTNWDRRFYPIPAGMVAKSALTIPTLTVATDASNVIRSMRVRFFPNPANLQPQFVDPLTFVGEFILSFMPKMATMVLDGTTEEVRARILDGPEVDATQLLYGTGGAPVSWPELTDGIPYLMTIDVPTGAPIPTTIALSLNRRE